MPRLRTANTPSLTAKAGRRITQAAVLCLMATVSCANVATAQNFSTPYGNPTGPSSADSPSYFWGYYTVTTDPTQAMGASANLPWAACLSAIGYTRTINYATLDGTYTLGDPADPYTSGYLVWAE